MSGKLVISDDDTNGREGKARAASQTGRIRGVRIYEMSREGFTGSLDTGKRAARDVIYGRASYRTPALAVDIGEVNS